MRSIHGRHSGEQTAPLDQCTRHLTLQAVDTAPVRSHAILQNLLLITLTSPWAWAWICSRIAKGWLVVNILDS